MYTIYFYFYFFLLTFPPSFSIFFFFNDTATTEIYTLSLHDALPILNALLPVARISLSYSVAPPSSSSTTFSKRSEEHTSELQSPDHLVCRLLLEKKKNKTSKDHQYRIRKITEITADHTISAADSRPQ